MCVSQLGADTRQAGLLHGSATPGTPQARKLLGAEKRALPAIDMEPDVWGLLKRQMVFQEQGIWFCS